MKQLTWDEYYAGFYDWSFSTRKSYSYGLTDFGDAEEVYEVVLELAYEDEKFATRFAEKAMNAGVRFEPDHVVELVALIDEPTLSRMAETASDLFDKDQLEELYGFLDDASFERISQKAKIDIFDEEESDEYETIHELNIKSNFIVKNSKRSGQSSKDPGFFATLLSLFAGSSGNAHHDGKCNGDCSNCPPHYGYRYGRWYYGKGHVRGCEFGGNRGDGSLP